VRPSATNIQIPGYPSCSDLRHSCCRTVIIVIPRGKQDLAIADVTVCTTVVTVKVYGLVYRDVAFHLHFLSSSFVGAHSFCYTTRVGLQGRSRCQTAG
jgi:hypothetical protein